MLDHDEQTLDKEYDVFISHATEDKDFVGELAEILSENEVKVWYDEYELTIGDSLRQKIDDGLAHSSFGIVVLSLSFFQKNWTKYEMDGLNARQVAGERIILPIWHRLTKNELLDFAPSLADIVALNSSIQTTEEIAAEIANKVKGGLSSSGQTSLDTSASTQSIGATLVSIGDVRQKLDEWAMDQREALLPIPSDGRYGYIESAHTLVRAEAPIWTPQEILKAAVSARNIPQDGFIPIQDGIEFRMGADLLTPSRYWKIIRSGESYSYELLMEDYEKPRFNSGLGHPEKTLWLDFGIGRIAKSLLDSAKIYEGLQVPSDETYLLAIKHNQIGGRTLYSYSYDVRYLYYWATPRVSQENSHTWQEEVTQDRINSQLVELTHEIANSLFFLFGFAEVSEGMVEEIIRQQGF